MVQTIRLAAVVPPPPPPPPLLLLLLLLLLLPLVAVIVVLWFTFLMHASGVALNALGVRHPLPRCL
jgi:hypothetical protein